MWFRLIILVSLGLIGLIFSLPPTLVGVFGGYKSKIVFTKDIQPGYQLVIKKRFAFPSFEVADPTSVVNFQIINQKTSDKVVSAKVEIYEDSDYSNPEISMQGRNVVLSKFDSSLPNKVITIKIP